MTLLATPASHIEAVLSLANAPQQSGDRDPIIARSWRRCVHDYGLDPARPSEARFVPRRVLREHQDQADELIAVARAGVEQLYRHVAELGYVILLTDSRGIAVQFLGDPADEKAHRKTGLYLGSDWGEDHAGTCAVGTCLKEQQALTCHQHDHFSAWHTNLTCTAVPMFNPQGQLLAVLDISALYSPPSKDSQTFALQLVKQYARMIEDAYFLRLYRDRPILCFDASREFVLINRHYLLALGDDGELLAGNTAARGLLAEHGLMTPGPFGSLTRARIDEFFDCELADILSIPYASHDQVRAFRTGRHNRLFFAALMEPRRAAPLPAERTAGAPRCALDALADDDPAMRKMLARAQRLCSEPLNVLLSGETGTGKERLARALHESGSRRQAPFVAINCGAVPESLIESELFGYAPGTFTGARSKGMRGLIQQADKGTLFLDEVCEMPLQLQVKLLRFLQTGTIQRLGSDRLEKVDVRIVCATNRDPSREVKEGRFREDLYYRLAVIPLEMPPLRKRGTDIRLLADAFLARFSTEVGKTFSPLSAAHYAALEKYPWPGNVRELQNALLRAVLLNNGPELPVSALPVASSVHPGGEFMADPTRPGTASALADEHCDDLAHVLAGRTLDEIERIAIEAAIEVADGNLAAAAQALGISVSTIYRKRQQIQSEG